MASCAASFRHPRFMSAKTLGIILAGIAAVVALAVFDDVCACVAAAPDAPAPGQPDVFHNGITRRGQFLESDELAGLLESMDWGLSRAPTNETSIVSMVVAKAEEAPAAPAGPPVEAAAPEAAPPAVEPAPPAPPAAAVPAPPVLEPQSKPASFTTLVALPKLSNTEFSEMSEQLAMSLGSELGYMTASSTVVRSLPSPPAGLIGVRTLVRCEPEQTHVLRFGCRLFISQPSQLWVMGVIVAEDGTLAINPDMALVEPQVAKMIASLNEVRTGLTIRDLEAKLVQLSYVDANAAISMLGSLGVTTADKTPAAVEFAQLPYVMKVPDPSKEYTGLIGEKTTAAKSKLSLAPGVASDMADNTIASPMTQLLVMFHPAHPEQFSEVRRLLDTFIDRPARQIFIEAMVLEISEEGLKELGVEWELKDAIIDITGGAQNAGLSKNTLNVNLKDTSLVHRIFNGQVPWDWDVTIRALIREGKAEVLSRPSVLTLDNRQSTIRVGTDVPVASSLEGMTAYTNRVSFNFEYLPIGILLNIRPRINEAGSEVSMLIDTIVSAKVPGQDLTIRAGTDGMPLASAPTVSTRRVQTYSRIGNNTPLIIGGLVARETIQTVDKVPLLGDIPWVGAAFRAEKNESLKREVIIVLTPHVLPEGKDVRRSFPKDEDFFDSFGNNLFRDSYRIRSEDVFDLSFLLENRRIVAYRTLARQVAEKNFRLADVDPFRSFVRDSVPGESILVTRMIYEVVKRLNIADKIEQSKIIYFKSQQQLGGYDVKFCDELLNDPATGKLKKFGDKALAITYRFDRQSLEQGRLGSEPIPDISLIDCPNREVWGAKLWELNQPTPDGRQRHTILIQNESDTVRLRRALALKKVIVLNGGVDQLRLRNFSVGKVLLMPELKGEQIHVIDADAAMFYFHTEHYYAAALARIEEQLKQLDAMLRLPEISVLLEAPLPDNNKRSTKE